jgi:hypothetical protein
MLKTAASRRKKGARKINKMQHAHVKVFARIETLSRLVGENFFLKVDR